MRGLFLKFCWLALFSLGSAAQASAPLNTIASLDVPRYMGTWYEIAKYPAWFQRKCVSSTSAHYSVLEAGRLQVVNRCKMANGEWNEAVGVARQIGGATSPQLKVRFAPDWLSFIPMVWGDYWVIAIDPQYQWVIVSEPSRQYMWILSRTPTLPRATYEQLLQQLGSLGFDLNKIETSAP
jgi:apolipoprotein D and lipocalin family protein